MEKIMNFLGLMLITALTFSLNAQPQYQHVCAITCKYALGDITFVKKLNSNLLLAVDEHGWAEILNCQEPKQTYRQYFMLHKNIFFPLHKTILYKDENQTHYLAIVMVHNAGHFKYYSVSDIKSSLGEDRKLSLENLYQTNKCPELLQDLLGVQSNIQDGAFSFSNHGPQIARFQKKMCTNNLIDLHSMPNFTPAMSYHDQNDTIIFGHRKGVVSVWTKNRK